MRERYQGGSLAGFIIIGVVLALVLVSGLYGLNRYNAEQSKEVASDQKDGFDEKANDENSPSSDAKSKDSQEQPKPEPAKKDDQTESDNKSEPGSGSVSTDTKLPATGPGETLVAFVAIAALGFSAAHYVQSRSRNR